MSYESLDTPKLQMLARDLRYDSQHKMEADKRAQAKTELEKVEAELREREGIRGLVRQVKTLLGSR
ncbi:MAG: hypothetical protein ABI690_16955 [Chloroflexota bacterium]